MSQYRCVYVVFIDRLNPLKSVFAIVLVAATRRALWTLEAKLEHAADTRATLKSDVQAHLDSFVERARTCSAAEAEIETRIAAMRAEPSTDVSVVAAADVMVAAAAVAAPLAAAIEAAAAVAVAAKEAVAKTAADVAAYVSAAHVDAAVLAAHEDASACAIEAASRADAVCSLVANAAAAAANAAAAAAKTSAACTASAVAVAAAAEVPASPAAVDSAGHATFSEARAQPRGPRTEHYIFQHSACAQRASFLRI